ncbi:MAG: TRAM domain-containing protein [Thaumarchaeota archaeon]|nr:TRAM domain-containing protein [Nitrososphaerota archaeon]
MANSGSQPHGYGFRPKPVSVGDELDVTIDEISRRGDGLVRVQGYVVFVPNTKRGDNVKIRIVKVRPSFAVAEVVE